MTALLVLHRILHTVVVGLSEKKEFSRICVAQKEDMAIRICSEEW